MTRAVSGTRVIAAPPGAIFDILANPAMHPVIDGTESVKEPASGGQARLAPGSEFSMRMRIVVPYRITNRVVEFEEGRRIAWTHIGGARWRYELEPVEGGTRVRETWDVRHEKALPGVLPQRWLVRKGMQRTLERLEAVLR